MLVVVKSVGAKKKGTNDPPTHDYDTQSADRPAVTRKDESVTENVSLQVQDDTAQATLSLWGSSANSPFGRLLNETSINSDVVMTQQGWKAGETILLIQSPGWKIGTNVRCVNELNQLACIY